LSDSVRVARTQDLSNEQRPETASSILTVCTGNVCRSPAVERLLASQLRPTVPIRSAGTHALVGHPISEPMAKLLQSNGADKRGFVARHLTESLVKEADLVLALTRARRSLIVELWPPSVRQTLRCASLRACSKRSMRPPFLEQLQRSGYALRCLWQWRSGASGAHRLRMTM
jgi:protein-tyrosine-phosphatase